MNTRGIRFSLGGFLVGVMVLAVGLAALASQSELSASAACTLYLGLICLATAGAILAKTERAFWVGAVVRTSGPSRRSDR